jgi:hypothetical protein
VLILFLVFSLYLAYQFYSEKYQPQTIQKDMTTYELMEKIDIQNYTYSEFITDWMWDNFTPPMTQSSQMIPKEYYD